MTKREFLDKLKKALVNDLSGSVIQENVNYYNDYITEEVRKGRRESDVIEELGDPWAIAKNIITSEEMKGNTQESYDSYEPGRRKENSYEQDYGSESGTEAHTSLDLILVEETGSDPWNYRNCCIGCGGGRRNYQSACTDIRAASDCVSDY